MLGTYLIPLAMIGFLLMSVVFFYYGIYKPIYTRDHMRRLHRSLKDVVQAQNEAEAAFESLSDEIELLSDKSRQLEDINRGYPASWLEVFESFVTSIPMDVSIMGLQTNNLTLRLYGTCVDDLTAAKLLTNLEKSGQNEDVRIERITYNDDGVNFEIICTLKAF
jgi:hypothetical protein